MKEEKKEIQVESSGTLAPEGVDKTMRVTGLEDVPTSMIPVPFYKLVQPGSTNVTLSDGKTDATPGTFYMGDSGKATDELKFLLLRAKRQKREFKGENGQLQQSVNMGVLGLNLDRMQPFILGVSVSSFSRFGRLMSQIKERKMENAWDYPIIATTEKREEVKQTPTGMQTVKYWVINFDLTDEKLSEEDLAQAKENYFEFASSLDRYNQEDSEDKEDSSDDLPF